MSNFVNLWTDILNIIADFLLSEPIIWFVGIIVLLLIVAILQRVFNISR